MLCLYVSCQTQKNKEVGGTNRKSRSPTVSRHKSNREESWIWAKALVKRSAAIGTTTDLNQSPGGKHSWRRKRREAFSKWNYPKCQHGGAGQRCGEPEIDELHLQGQGLRRSRRGRLKSWQMAQELKGQLSPGGTWGLWLLLTKTTDALCSGVVLPPPRG